MIKSWLFSVGCDVSHHLARPLLLSRVSRFNPEITVASFFFCIQYFFNSTLGVERWTFNSSSLFLTTHHFFFCIQYFFNSTLSVGRWMLNVERSILLLFPLSQHSPLLFLYSIFLQFDVERWTLDVQLAPTPWSTFSSVLHLTPSYTYWLLSPR